MYSLLIQRYLWMYVFHIITQSTDTRKFPYSLFLSNFLRTPDRGRYRVLLRDTPLRNHYGVVLPVFANFRYTKSSTRRTIPTSDLRIPTLRIQGEWFRSPFLQAGKEKSFDFQTNGTIATINTTNSFTNARKNRNDENFSNKNKRNCLKIFNEYN